MTSKTMESRLSFQELKAQKGRVITNLEAIKGGNLNNCHTAPSTKSKTKVSIAPDIKIKGGKIDSWGFKIKIYF